MKWSVRVDVENDGVGLEKEEILFLLVYAVNANLIAEVVVLVGVETAGDKEEQLVVEQKKCHDTDYAKSVVDPEKADVLNFRVEAGNPSLDYRTNQAAHF